ncbi:MAG TPA: SDR family oxidoreductase [Gemmatimonadaceae bacterium]|nr:SDR family oxidoreductase [Gemmatimonadaceae bacterium]
MNVLVTGATGFIGQALVGRLADCPGVTVRAGVRRRSDVLPSLVTQVVVPELGSGGDWHSALAGVHSVVHLAARVHMTTDPSADPLSEYRRVNLEGTLSLARQAASSGVRRFVFASTVKVNGESTRAERPFTESDAPAPADAYGLSKAEAEAALFEVGATSGMEIVVIRPTLVYGPGVKANFRSMTRWLQRGLPLPLGAIHHNRRSLIGIDNLVDLILTCLRHPAAANEVFLAADGEDLSTTGLLRRTAAALGVQPRLIPVPAGLVALVALLVGKRSAWRRLGGSLHVDITKARTRLDWCPPVSVDEGLRRAVLPLMNAKRPE